MTIRSAKQVMQNMLDNVDAIIAAISSLGVSIDSDSNFPQIISKIQSIAIGIPENTINGILDIINGEVINGNYINKSTAISDSKESIRQAIIAKGVEILESDPFSIYDEAIGMIDTGISESTIDTILDGINGESVAGGYVEKSDAISSSKEDIRQSIISKGGTLDSSVPLKDYNDAIDAIPLGVPEASIEVAINDVNGEVISGNWEAKIASTSSSKESTRQAIIAKGVAVAVNVPLSGYPAKVAAIAQGIPTVTVEGLLDTINGEVISGNYNAKNTVTLASKEATRQAIIAKGVNVPVGTALSGYPAKIAAITPSYVTPRKVETVDWDGVILKSEVVENGTNATAPSGFVVGSAHPTESRLIFRGWNGSYSNITEDTTIQPTYTTDSGKTYIFVNVNSGTAIYSSFRIQKNYADAVTFSWNDGTADTVITTTGSIIVPSHFWSTPGIKVVTMTVAAGRTVGLGIGNSTNPFMVSEPTSLIGIIIGSSCTLGGYCFNNCWALKKVVISEGITQLGSYSFNECETLDNLAIPNSITSLQGNVFPYCYSLKYMVVPASVTTFPANFNSSCLSLQYIKVMNDSWTPTTNYIFNTLSSLRKLRLPFSAMLTITQSMFYGCRALKGDYVFPNVTDIQSQAFYQASGLTSLEFGAGLLTIGSTAFAYATGLDYIIFRSITPPTLGLTALSSVSKIIKIYVPDSSVATYKAATNWTSYSDLIYPLSSKP